MIKSFNKNTSGEITTAVALFVIITSLIGIVAGYTAIQSPSTFNTKSKAATCAEVTSIDYNPKPLGNGTDFRCNVNITSASVASSQYSMTCGWSKNGGWPQNGDRWQNATCNGTNCHFDIRMDPSLDPNAAYELVGYDFKSECGPGAPGAKRISLSAAGGNPAPTSPQPGENPTSSPQPTQPLPSPTRSAASCGAYGQPCCPPGQSIPGNEESGCNTSNLRCDNFNFCVLKPSPTQIPTITTRPTTTNTPSPTPTNPPNATCGHYGMICCTQQPGVWTDTRCQRTDLTCDNSNFCVPKPTLTPIPTQIPTQTPQPSRPSSTPAPTTVPNSYFELLQQAGRLLSPPTSTPTPQPDQNNSTTEEPPQQKNAAMTVSVNTINNSNISITHISLALSRQENTSEQPFYMVQSYTPNQQPQLFSIEEQQGKNLQIWAIAYALDKKTYSSTIENITVKDTGSITIDLAVGPTGVYEAVNKLQQLTKNSLDNFQKTLLNIPIIGIPLNWLFSNAVGTI